MAPHSRAILQQITKEKFPRCSSPLDMVAVVFMWAKKKPFSIGKGFQEGAVPCVQPGTRLLGLCPWCPRAAFSLEGSQGDRRSWGQEGMDLVRSLSSLPPSPQDEAFSALWEGEEGRTEH